MTNINALSKKPWHSLRVVHKAAFAPHNNNKKYDLAHGMLDESLSGQ